MIDRTHPVFLLRPRTHLWLAAGVGAVWLLMPACALLITLIGGLISVVIWLATALGYLLGVALLLGAVAVLIAGFVTAANESNGGAGCGGVIGALILGWLGKVELEWWHAFAAGWWQGGVEAFLTAASGAGRVMVAWVDWGVVWVPWAVGLTVAAVVALAVLAMVGALRVADRLRAHARQVRYYCPTGHTGRVQFGCPGCRRWEAELKPTVFGVRRARCECGRAVPTTDLFGRGRAVLLRRCGRCHAPLTHPRLGQLAEVQVQVWGANAGGWAAAAAVAAERGGAHASGSPPNAILLEGRSVGPALLYLTSGDSGDRPPAGAVVLLLDVDPRADSATGVGHDDGGVDDVLHQLERMNVRAVPVAVCVRWRGGPFPGRAGADADHSPAVRRGLLAAGLNNSVGLIERRFGRVRFFALTPGPGELADAASEPGAVLRWVGQSAG